MERTLLMGLPSENPPVAAGRWRRPGCTARASAAGWTSFRAFGPSRVPWHPRCRMVRASTPATNVATRMSCSPGGLPVFSGQSADAGRLAPMAGTSAAADEQRATAMSAALEAASAAEGCPEFYGTIVDHWLTLDTNAALGVLPGAGFHVAPVTGQACTLRPRSTVPDDGVGPAGGQPHRGGWHYNRRTRGTPTAPTALQEPGHQVLVSAPPPTWETLWRLGPR